MASVFPIPVIVPESAARTDVPEGIPMSMPLCPDPLYTCGFAVENGVVPKYCVMQKRLPSAPDLEMHPCAKVEEYGHARTPEPTLGMVVESTTTLRLSSSAERACSKARCCARFSVMIDSYVAAV